VEWPELAPAGCCERSELVEADTGEVDSGMDSGAVEGMSDEEVTRCRNDFARADFERLWDDDDEDAAGDGSITDSGLLCSCWQRKWAGGAYSRIGRGGREGGGRWADV